MNRKFRCGRLIRTNDGTIKKIELDDGGGSRYCTWDDKDMDFETVHHRLLNIFELNNSNLTTSLYDFRHRPLDTNSYENLSQYIDKYGLNRNSTIIYLCTSETDNAQPKTIVTKTKDIVVTKTSTLKQKQSTVIRISSSITSGNNEKTSKQQQLNKCSLEYGFITSINSLIKKCHSLINENDFDEILIQLLQNISTIQAYNFLTITKLQEQLRRSNEFIQLMNKNEILLYSNDINYIYDICQSTEELFISNKKKFCHIQLFSTIISVFCQFFNNLKNLRNQWLENVETISSYSYDHCEINTEDSIERSTISFSQTFSSSLQESIDKETQEKFDLFQTILIYLNGLLNLLHPEHLSKFHTFILSSIGDLKSIRSTINFHDKQSLRDAKRVILLIRNQINQTFYQQDINHCKNKLDEQLDQSCRKILKAIRVLFIILHRYQMQVNQE